MDCQQKGRGAERIDLPLEVIEPLLRMKFKVPEIAKELGVCVNTIRRRMKELGLSVSQMYTDISDSDLELVITSILVLHPHTGYKKLKGLLTNYSDIRVTEARLLHSLRKVDPKGVLQRRIDNRAIVRRKYFVKYAGQLYHMDTNMKLNRYKMILKGCIDGKSRSIVFLDIADNNRAISTLESFREGIKEYPIPMSIRTDRGGENVLVGRFMLQVRGKTGVITGKSCHNQRIERYWGDAYKDTGPYYDTFIRMEERGILNIDDPNHLFVLHHVYLPRIQRTLTNARLSWNQHPLSTEHNHSPVQLFVQHRPPNGYGITATPERIEQIFQDCAKLFINEEDYEPEGEAFETRNPSPIKHSLTYQQLQLLNDIDILRASLDNGVDIYLECMIALGLM